MKFLIFYNAKKFKELIETTNFNFFFHFMKLTYKERLEFCILGNCYNIKFKVINKKYLSFLPNINFNFYNLLKDKTLICFLNNDKHIDILCNKIYANSNEYLINISYKLFNRLFSNNSNNYLMNNKLNTFLNFYNILYSSIKIKQI